MKNSFKFISESKDNVALLEGLNDIVMLYDTKIKDDKVKESLEEIQISFNEKMYDLIESGLKDIDIEKMSANGKKLLMSFVVSAEVKEIVGQAVGAASMCWDPIPKGIFNSTRAIKILNSLLELYASKRRGEDVKQTFEELKQSFISFVPKMIKAGITDFHPEKLPPFSLELFDKYTDYKYIATKEDGSKESFNTFDDLKASKVEYKEHQLDIKMKEAEKKIGNFTYYKQWWKGKGRTIESFIISTDIGIDLHLDSDLLSDKFKESIFYLKPSTYNKYRISESVEFISPDSKRNVTTMPSWVKQLDVGKISILESSELEKVLEFSGNGLKLIYTAKREGENSDFWSLQKESKHKE